MMCNHDTLSTEPYVVGAAGHGHYGRPVFIARCTTCLAFFACQAVVVGFKDTSDTITDDQLAAFKGEIDKITRET